MADNKTTANQNYFKKYRDKITIALVILGLALIVFIFYAAQASSAGQFFSIIGVSISIAGAALVAGVLLGFLFGIPRTLQQGTEGENPPTPKAAGANQSVSYRPNTNLEQISDWLTKILVGVGLTQIASIPGALKNYAEFISPGLGNFDNSKVFGIGILGLFLIIGFLAGFLLTRIYLPKAFHHGDIIERIETVKTELEKQRELDAKAIIAAQHQLNPEKYEKELTLPELKEAIKNASNAARDEVFDLAQKMRSHSYDEGKKDLIEKTIPIFRALIATDTENKYHEYHGELAMALSDKKIPDYSEAKAELDTAIKIRGVWQAGQDENELYYESYRANCLINFDENFRQGKKSEINVQQAIVNDLKAAFKNEKIKKDCLDEKKADIAVLKWAAINGIDPKKDI
jgi:hypothetical protein